MGSSKPRLWWQWAKAILLVSWGGWGQWAWKRWALPGGLTSSRVALIGVSRECSQLGLGWVSPVYGFSNNHMEDNCDEIWGGLLLGECIVVWESRAARLTPASPTSRAGLPNCCQTWRPWLRHRAELRGWMQGCSASGQRQGRSRALVTGPSRELCFPPCFVPAVFIRCLHLPTLGFEIIPSHKWQLLFLVPWPSW